MLMTALMRYAALGLVMATTMLPARAIATQVVDHVVAIVNNDVITRREVDGLLAMSGGSLPRTSGLDGGLHARIIERLIDERLLQQAMETEKVELTAEELQTALNNFLAANRLTRDQFRAALAQRGMRLDTFQQQMAGQLRQMKFIQTKVGGDIQMSDRELQNFYRRQVNPQTQQTTFHLSEIVLQATASPRRTARLAQHARTGDFAALAKSHSTSPTAVDGGHRSNVALADLRPELAAAVQRLRVGQVSDPITTPDGIFILKLNAERSPTDADFQQRKPQIQQALFQDKMTDALEQYLGTLRAKAYIEIRD